MIQALARWIGGIALHWFYSDICVIDADRIPRDGPILIAMNHQNALVDALLAFWIVPRNLRLTGKATIGDTATGALLMRMGGVIPLSRASDDPISSSPLRNRRSFEAMIDELQRGGAVLLFPEGRSHNDPQVAPLKTGLARAALRARHAGVRGVRIVPIGVTFENKAEPDTAVLAEVAQPLEMDKWAGEDAHKLTDEIAARLRAVSLVRDLGANRTPVAAPTVARRNPLIRLAAWWGSAMHYVPLRLARRRAMKYSADPGEPAMYTMTLGLGAILLSYLIEVPVVWYLFGWAAAVLFLASLITGAYWAAYADHSPERSRR